MSVLRAPPQPGRSRLGGLVRRAQVVPDAAHERCELCGEAISDAHRHLLDLADGQLRCACRACGLLFDHDGAGGGRFRSVPERRRAVALDVDDGDLQALGVPVGLVFFARHSVTGDVVARFPSPAGPAEAALDDAVWARLVERAPVLGGLLPDVEAFLVNRVAGAREHWIVPIDDCYRLLAVFRTSWRGLSGGDTVWPEIAGLFHQIRRTAYPEDTRG